MYGVDFVEQFGYGFGYAGYTIVLQRIAQRGTYRTAHYALGVGVGALFIQVAGVLSGVFQANFGYTGLFLAAVFLAIPGLGDDPVPAAGRVVNRSRRMPSCRREGASARP